MIFDIKVNRFELMSDGTLYIEYSPANEELNNYVINCNTYDLINNSIERTISHYKPTVRNDIYNSLPSEIKDLYVNSQYKINGSIGDPSNIDYDLFGFHKKKTIEFGELRETQYYRNFDSTNYSDLILTEYREYFRDENGMCQYREQRIEWFLTNNEVGLTKNSTKYYTLMESIQEGVDRRTNCISNAKAYTLETIGREDSFDFLYTVKDQIEFFIDGNTQPLIDAIQYSTKPYLNQTIKDGMIESLRLS